MSRTRKPKVKLTPEQRRERRKLRQAQRADSPVIDTAGRTYERTEHHEEQFWARTRDRGAAAKILNDHRERPYWMSMPKRPGPDPIAGYFPCSLFFRDGRVYYGFLFRQHRDKFFERMKPRGAVKELTA